MKIAVGIIGLILGLLVLLQSCTLAGVSSLGSDSSMTAAGQVGMFVGLLFFVGGAFGFGLPLVSAIVFAIAALFGFIASGKFGDMGLWATVALLLAALSAFAWYSGRAKRRRAEQAAKP
jgi:hypothetical protein